MNNKNFLKDDLLRLLSLLHPLTRRRLWADCARSVRYKSESDQRSPPSLAEGERRKLVLFYSKRKINQERIWIKTNGILPYHAGSALRAASPPFKTTLVFGYEKQIRWLWCFQLPIIFFWQKRGKCIFRASGSWLFFNNYVVYISRGSLNGRHLTFDGSCVLITS